MSYRTPTEKPMIVNIRLTDEELSTAIREYLETHKGMPIPENCSEYSLQHWVAADWQDANSNYVRFVFKDPT